MCDRSVRIINKCSLVASSQSSDALNPNVLPPTTLHLIIPSSSIVNHRPFRHDESTHCQCLSLILALCHLTRHPNHSAFCLAVWQRRQITERLQTGKQARETTSSLSRIWLTLDDWIGNFQHKGDLCSAPSVHLTGQVCLPLGREYQEERDLQILNGVLVLSWIGWVYHSNWRSRYLHYEELIVLRTAVVRHWLERLCREIQSHQLTGSIARTNMLRKERTSEEYQN